MTRPYSRHQADVAERPCTRCGTTLPLDDFPANLRMRDGHSSWCRPCAAARTREWRAGIRDEYNARRRVNREARPCDGCGLEITGRMLVTKMLAAVESATLEPL